MRASALLGKWPDCGRASAKPRSTSRVGGPGARGELETGDRMPGSDEALLAGLTVLDFTRVLAGPYCTRLLADLGARVIKVERPGEGDETRRGYVQVEEARTDQATYFIRVNAGKRSVAIDLA